MKTTLRRFVLTFIDRDVMLVPGTLELWLVERADGTWYGYEVTATGVSTSPSGGSLSRSQCELAMWDAVNEQQRLVERLTLSKAMARLVVA